MHAVMMMISHMARQTEFTVYRHNFFCFACRRHYSDFILATVCNTGTTNHKLQETGNHTLPETGNHKLKETTKPQTLQACKLLTRQDLDRPRWLLAI